MNLTYEKDKTMESLSVKNFLIIKRANIDVGKITLIIGPQASGKSIAAKLLYFFREFVFNTFLDSVENLENKKQLVKRGKSDFEKYFPKYAWIDLDFKIVYKKGDFEVSIVHQRDKRGNAVTRLDYSNGLATLHRKIKSDYRKELALCSMGNMPYYSYVLLSSVIDNSSYKNNFENSTFIPASRSFFANLQKNVFSFLAKSLDIDPFLKKFGFDYEVAKKYYHDPFDFKNDSERNLAAQIRELIEIVLTGKYRYENDQDWIECKNRKINLADASSGQQEALPMLLVMLVWPFLHRSARNTFFIEEPEAHLFPVSQKHIVSIIASIYKTMGHSFVITTHSPYILTAINNLILASEVSKEIDSGRINKIVDGNFHIKFEDVGAYTIKDGVAMSVLDGETRLIGPSVIDSVSDEFDNVFDSLIELQLGAES